MLIKEIPLLISGWQLRASDFYFEQGGVKNISDIPQPPGRIKHQTNNVLGMLMEKLESADKPCTHF